MRLWIGQDAESFRKSQNPEKLREAPGVTDNQSLSISYFVFFQEFILFYEKVAYKNRAVADAACLPSSEDLEEMKTKNSNEEK